MLYLILYLVLNLALNLALNLVLFKANTQLLEDLKTKVSTSLKPFYIKLQAVN